MAATASKIAKSTVHYEKEVPTVSAQEWASNLVSNPKDKVRALILIYQIVCLCFVLGCSLSQGIVPHYIMDLSV
jgi:hypothetical protein